MKSMLIFLMLIISFFTSDLKAQSVQDVVNDTLWTLQMETSNFDFTCSEGHNRF